MSRPCGCTQKNQFETIPVSKARKNKKKVLVLIECGKKTKKQWIISKAKFTEIIRMAQHKNCFQFGFISNNNL